MVGAGWGILALATPLDVLLFPESGERHTPISIFAGLILLLAHLIWISMDRTRRGREVGAWRFLAIFLGPLAVCLYLLLEYRLRGVLYILYYVALIAGGWLTGIALSFGLLRIQGVA